MSGFQRFFVIFRKPKSSLFHPFQEKHDKFFPAKPRDFILASQGIAEFSGDIL
jgi:hypothetical protein